MAATMGNTFNYGVCSSPSLVSSSSTTRRSDNLERNRQQCRLSSSFFTAVHRSSLFPAFSFALSIKSSKHQDRIHVVACVPPSQPQKTTTFTSSTKLYVSGEAVFVLSEKLDQFIPQFKGFYSISPYKSLDLFRSSLPRRTKGLSFRTSEESLRNAFQSFGQLIEVNLVMDKMANRPRGFAFLRYATKEESEKAIEGMHGKFLDGRVIFVEFAKPRSQLHQGVKQNSKPYR